MNSAALINLRPLTRGLLSSYALPALGAISTRFCSCTGQSKKKHKIAVVGAAGGIGQPLSLLLKLNPSVGDLRLIDIRNTAGVAADLSHIETPAKVSHRTSDKPCEVLKGGVDIIVVPAGVPRKPNMKREDLFAANAQVVFDVATAMAEHSPDAVLLIITNPINSVIPIACEVLKKHGKLCPGKVMGVSTLDSVRSATFIGELTNTDAREVAVPLIGGHSGTTIIPLLSRANPQVCLEGEKRDQFVKRIQEAGTEVVKAKAGGGSATLSTAYATSRLLFGIIRAMQGDSNIVESVYVMSDVYPDLKYLATPCLMGKNGVEKNLGLGKMNEYESNMFCEAVQQLKKDIAVGEKFAREQSCKTKC